MVKWKSQLLWCCFLISVAILSSIPGCRKGSQQEPTQPAAKPIPTKEIKHRAVQRHFTIMTEPLPPFNYQEHGRLVGLSVDKLVKAMEMVGNPIKRSDIQVLPWARAYQRVQNEKNTMLFSMARTKEREKLFKWVGPICELRIGILALKKNNIKLKSIKDVQNYSISTVRSGAPEQLLISQSGISPDKLVRVTEPMQSIRQLHSGRVQLFPFNIMTAMYLIEKNGLDPSEFELVHVMKKVAFYYAFHRDTDDDFIKELNDALVHIHGPGAMELVNPNARKLIVSGHPDYAPIMWQHKDTLSGVGARAVKVICEKLKIPYEIRSYGPWKRVQEEARHGHVDLILGIYDNEERRQYLDYTEPYLEDLTSVSVIKDSSFRLESRDNLVGKVGVTIQGDSFGQDLDAYIASSLNLQRANSPEAMFKNLVDGRVDYILWGYYPTLVNAKRLGYDEKIKVLSKPLVTENMYMAFSKKSPFCNRLKEVNEIIRELKESGAIQRWTVECMLEYGEEIQSMDETERGGKRVQEPAR